MSESTRVLHAAPSAAGSAHTASLPMTVPPNGSVGRNVSYRRQPDKNLDDFLQLEECKIAIDHDADALHDSSEGRLDIHLTSPLIDRDGMCMQIYGVPETWLRLVSQTTRMANILDGLQPSSSCANIEASARLHSKSLALENAVCRFATQSQSSSPSASLHACMVRALSAALVIFFYRRIRSVHPLILQESVTRVVDSLHAFDTALEQGGMLGPGTAWPAFMAGAEAMSPQQRHDIGAWLDKAHSKSGWKSYSTSRRILDEVWKQRNAVPAHAELPTWMSVCRQLRCWPLLC